jgi:hypothetical protein
MSLLIGPFAAGGRLIATDWGQHARRQLRGSYRPATAVAGKRAIAFLRPPAWPLEAARPIAGPPMRAALYGKRRSPLGVGGA